MRNAVAAALLAVTVATPAMAQVPDMQQLLRGLTSGNQNQDQALRDAFERGYQRGRQDEARLSHSGRSGANANRFDRRGPNDRNGSDPSDDRQDYRGNPDYNR